MALDVVRCLSEMIEKDDSNFDGGKGSGNWGHEGRPGKVGGSGEGGASTSPTSHKVVEGKDISETWTRRSDKFQYEIDDVINAQGFDGVPKVIDDDEEFEKAVKASGFIAQRTYSAPDAEIALAYKEQLYNGDWYVDCSEGGAAHGRGMYCAADYHGELTKGIKEEMEYYSHATLDTDQEDVVWDALPTIKKGLIDEYGAKKGEELFAKTDKMSAEEIVSNYPEYFKGKNIPCSIVETFTLDPSAKIIKSDDLKDIKHDSKQFVEKRLQQMNLNDDEMNVVRRELSIGTREQRNSARVFEKENPDRYKEIVDKHFEKAESIMDSAMEQYHKLRALDDGSFAAMLGYDAINAEGHGRSGSYTVILNRSKVIFKGGKKK